MSESTSLMEFITVLVIVVAAAYALAAVLVRKPGARVNRVLLTAALATVLLHAYLWLFAGGVDQFLLISVVVMFTYGLAGGFLLDWLRGRLRKRH